VRDISSVAVDRDEELGTHAVTVCSGLDQQHCRRAKATLEGQVQRRVACAMERQIVGQSVVCPQKA
jgi:hypothetical protein